MVGAAAAVVVLVPPHPARGLAPVARPAPGRDLAAAARARAADPSLADIPSLSHGRDPSRVGWPSHGQSQSECVFVRRSALRVRRV